jgi:inhibitor of KinA
VADALPKSDPQTGFPMLRNVGFSGVSVCFSDHLTEAANRAALSFRARVDAAGLPGIIETTTSLTSAFVSYDPTVLPQAALRDTLAALLEGEDWLAAHLPENRRLWRIPASFSGVFAPQLEEAAALAGLTPAQAVDSIAGTQVRVMTLGFAPGQPYLGILPQDWDIPRQTGLTKNLPPGAIAVAIRQLVLFTTETPTGWRQVGRCGFRGFRPEALNPFALCPGDEIRFDPVSEDRMQDILANDRTGNGAASVEDIL